MSTPNGALNSSNNDCCDSRSSDKPAIDLLNSEKVAILSCSAQHSPKLIDRNVRELEVETQILPLNTLVKELLKEQYKAIIIAGGPGSVFAEDALPYDKDIFTTGIPVLGIGYGFQMINNHFGGLVGECKEEHKDSAQLTIIVDSQNLLFSNLDSQQKVLQATGVSVSKVADGFEVVGKSENVIFAIANVEKKLYGVQFYPENDLSTNGKDMLKNFLFYVASLSGNFTQKFRVDKSIDRIQKLVGSSKVLVLVNGGVNSVVSATFLVKALKADQVIALYIDSGFMRKNEGVQVEKALKSVGLDMKTIKAWLQFSNATT
ncbi:PREDICTED: GMP synthase [glutamine-hydrolyzing]-like, partial [Rhagoletis zephyria]|uniref:GMP synthase [glutamine-hydrolyzing]-like n=1 Tax=Rhagoletis zephyria TaxID=28612 RepID=UPI0008112E48